MRILLWPAFALAVFAQDPNTLDQFRTQLSRISPNPIPDSANLPRIALRAPLLADPSVPLSELLSVQDSLLRLSRIAPPVLATPPPDFQPTLLPARPPLHMSMTGNLALGKPTSQSSVRFFSSRGGVDGRYSNAYGFDTQREANPWWQVDLERLTPVTEIRIHNHQAFPERARTLTVLLSLDGASWKTVYTNHGTAAGVIRIPLTAQTARWVRVQLNATEILSLNEVEIF